MRNYFSSVNSKHKSIALAAISAAFLGGVLLNGQQFSSADEDGGTNDKKAKFTDVFFIEDCTFIDTGINPFFILEPHYQLVLTGEEDDSEVELIITVLDETREVDGVTTRVVEERESVDGGLVEISRNFFAICEETNSVFYFGEEVDNYEDGEIVSHEGGWLAGEDDAEAGIIMPGTILLGSRYQQEVAPDVALDRAEIISMDETVDTPTGEFDHVLQIKETNPLEKNSVEYKYHVRDVGLIQDENLKLEEYGFIS